MICYEDIAFNKTMTPSAIMMRNEVDCPSIRRPWTFRKTNMVLLPPSFAFYLTSESSFMCFSSLIIFIGYRNSTNEDVWWLLVLVSRAESLITRLFKNAEVLLCSFMFLLYWQDLFWLLPVRASWCCTVNSVLTPMLNSLDIFDTWQCTNLNFLGLLIHVDFGRIMCSGYPLLANDIFHDVGT